MLLLGLSASAGANAEAPRNFEAAKSWFSGLSVNDRLRIQLLLTAAGHWPSVPSVNFGHRLFNAIEGFQSDYGYPSTGQLDAAERAKLEGAAAPFVQQWGFREAGHPWMGRPIWIPFGLGLQPQHTAAGIKWEDPQHLVSIQYGFFNGLDLATSYNTILAEKRTEGDAIPFSVFRHGFFVISSSTPAGIDSYLRYYQVGGGLLGFVLNWQHTGAADLHIERVATLISGSFWARMTGAPFLTPSELVPTPTFAPPPSPPSIAAVTPPPAVSQEASVSPPPAPKPASPPAAPAPASPKASGSGFFVGSDGKILTNAHVISDCSAIEAVTLDPAASSPAHVVAQDRINDLALLATTLKPAAVATIRNDTRLGEQVEAFGFPLAPLLSTSGNFTVGNITAESGLSDDSRYLQVSSPVQHGNSGGPLLDQDGNVIGVVSAKLNALKIMLATEGSIPQNVNFAIKGRIVTAFLSSHDIDLVGVPSTKMLVTPDIASLARKMSVLVKCY